MKKFVLIAVLMLAVMSVPAFASVQNIKVSGDIDSTFLVRDGFDLGASAGAGESDRMQNLLITQTRLRVDADLTEGVSATVALINERAWDNLGDDDTSGTDPDNSNDVDLNLAFVTLREMLYSPLTVHIGRQAFKYGNSFIYDTGGTNNVTAPNTGLSGVAADLTKSTAQDAVRAVLDYNPLTLEIVFARTDANTLSASGANKDDVSVYGANATYNLGDDWNTVAEGYFWHRRDNSVSGGSATGIKSDTLYIPGLRVSTNPVKGLNTQLEFAFQLGRKANTSTTGTTVDNVPRQAIGGQAIVNYALPFEQTAKWNPVTTFVYTYVSGDENADPSGTQDGVEDKYNSWDPFFENQGGGTIYNTLFDLTNVHIYVLSAQVNPIEDVTAKVTYTRMRIDKNIPSGVLNIRQPDTTSFTAATANVNKKDVGYEVDGLLSYAYTEDVTFGLNVGWFFPGRLFSKANRESAKQVLLNANVNF